MSYRLLNAVMRFATVALAAMVMTVHAQEAVRFDVHPQVLRVGESTSCRITISGQNQAGTPSLPPIPGFDLGGTSMESSMSIVNGVQQSSITYVYQLIAREAGTFQIGPFGFNLNGQSQTIGPAEVTVVAGTAPGTSAAAGQEDYLFATLRASAPEAYVQQPLQLELSLYWRDLNMDREVALNGFDTTGLRMGGWQELQVSREAVKGQVYEVRRFRCQAIPLTAGTFTLSPQLRVQVLVRNQSRRGDPVFGGAFDDLFFGGFRAQPTDVNVPPLSLTIRDLPTEGRPPEFNGAIGQYRMEVNRQPATVAVGEPVTLTARISGPGNLDTVSAPVLSPTEDFRRYEPKLTGQDAASAQKTFELVLIPKHAGITNVPPVRFAYFDPVAGRYERIDYTDLPLRVEGQSATTRIIQTPEQGSGLAQPAPTGVDITHIKTTVPRWRTNPNRLAPTGWLAVQSLPVLALLGSWWWARARQRLQNDPVHARRKQAPQSARKALAEALRCLEKEPAARFYEALWQLLVTYFGHRFNLAPGEVSAGEVSRRLLAAGWDIERTAEITRLFDACESRRFGGGSATSVILPAGEQSAWRTELEKLVDHFRACEKLR